jgi:hypothetical protein
VPAPDAGIVGHDTGMVICRNVMCCAYVSNPYG